MTPGALPRIWIVTRPTAASILPDILFETDAVGLQRQFAGGLDAVRDDVAMFADQDAAIAAARARLDARDAGAATTPPADAPLRRSWRNTHCDSHYAGCRHTTAATCSCDCVPCFNAFLHDGARLGIDMTAARRRA